MTARAPSAPPPTGVAAPRRRLSRRRDRLVGGVAGGIANHLGLSVRLVRVLFLVLTFGGGLGVLLYAVYWIVLPGSARVRRSWVDAAGTAIAVVIGLAIVTTSWVALPFGRMFVPSVLSVLGGAFMWRQATDVERARWFRASRTTLTADPEQWAGRLRIAAGVLLIVLGIVAVVIRADPAAVGDGLVAVAVTVVGLALITGPWWVRLMADLTAERRERVRSQERADLAAAVHDSVLQTLALIQRHADDPRAVAGLARRQERELRSVLYGAPATGSLAAALAEAMAEVEDGYGVTVDAVVVGDAAMTPALTALVAAAGEASVNSAKHSGLSAVSVYAEVEPAMVTVFVRDRGVGFELDDVPADRLGVRRSIIDRVQRHGGRAVVRSHSGAGTEVELQMPR